MIFTAACPQHMIADANNFAAIIARGPEDLLTYNESFWVDSENNLYSAAYWEAPEEWALKAQSALTRPSWDTSNLIDIDAATRAQSALVFSVNDAVLASPNSLTVIAGPSSVEALKLMGLSLKEF